VKEVEVGEEEVGFVGEKGLDFLDRGKMGLQRVVGQSMKIFFERILPTRLQVLLRKAE
jgi:hypothetical protein